MIDVQFYAVLKDYFGQTRAIGSCESVNDLIEILVLEVPNAKQVLSNVKIAVNNQFVPITTALKDGDVISLLPPSSGG